MKNLYSILLTSCLLALSGCISYSENQLSSVKQWPMAASSQPKPTAYLKVDSQYLLNDNAQAGGFNQAALEKLILQTYQESGLFSRVTTAQQTSDLYITVHVSNHERASMASAFLTGLTLYIIPSTASNELSMQTEFRDGSGELLGSVEKRETITTWMQLLLIFALPFSESTDNVLTQLSQSSLEAAAQQKLL
jgi:hypothetical protein